MKVMRFDLGGEWKLGFTLPKDTQWVEYSATVPGNVEAELEKNGLIENVMPDDNVYATTRFETVDDWTYTTEFDAPQFENGWTQKIVFEGIDTIADIFLNDEKVYEARDMYVPHEIDVCGKLKAKGNTLKVVIRSAMRYAQTMENDIFGVSREHTGYGGQAYLRKARHSWGWDNAPRLITHGIYRPVYIESLPPERFGDVYLYTAKVTEEAVSLGIIWDYIPADGDHTGYTIRYTLKSGDKTAYCAEKSVMYVRGSLRFEVAREDIDLWWPRGFGEANLCDITLEMFKGGEKKAEWSDKWGIRTLRLERTDDISENNEGEFVFVVNNEKIYINGTNWKPLDALHSRADAKVEKTLDLAYDLNCNMIRIWGGGIYEGDAFFNYCDSHGIMVWQDFMFGCEFPPRDEWYCKQVAWETAIIIRKLRNHASLAVWCGDNEDDECLTWTHMDSTILPSDNRITRKILRECVLRFDPYRSYVESSPYVSDANMADRRKGNVTHFKPEEHLYPQTIEFDKALRECRSRFIGETGPIRVNAMTDNERIWKCEESRAVRLWDTPISMKDRNLCMHQTDDYFETWRQTGKELCEVWFGRDFSSAEWKDYCLAINIICGDVFKEVIEACRTDRWNRTGVIWWSLYDMWPMLFNYSVVDVDYHKKMPYYWIRQSQQFFALMIVRRELNGEADLYSANDTLSAHEGRYRIYSVDGTEIASGFFQEKANSARMLQRLPEPGDKPDLWIIEWTENGKTCYNHFVTNGKHTDFETWRSWAQKLNELYGAQ